MSDPTPTCWVQDSPAYWAGWYDSCVAYGNDLLRLVTEVEGSDWYKQDVAMLASLNG